MLENSTYLVYREGDGDSLGLFFNNKDSKALMLLTEGTMRM